MTQVCLLGVGLLGLGLFASAEGAEPAKPGSPKSQAEHVELPMHLRWVRENATSRPPPEVRREVRAEDKWWLIREYRRQRGLNERVASSWLLAYLGDDEVFRLFSERLRLGRGSRWIEESELAGLDEQLYAMGIVAQTNDLAFDFLKEAINPVWWKRERKWRVKWREPGSDAYLAEIAGRAESAIKALGLSARAEAGILLDSLRQKGCDYVSPEDPREQWSLAPAAYTAKRFLEVSRKMGREAFRDGLFGSEFRRFSLEWRKSEEGMEWYEWCTPKEKFPWMWRNMDRHFKDAEDRGD